MKKKGMDDGSYIGVLCNGKHRYKRQSKTLRNKHGDCTLCLKERSSKYYQSNKKAIIKRNAAYAKRNKKSIRLRKQKWYIANRRRIKKQQSAYHKENSKDRNNKRDARYHKKKRK